MWVEIGEKLFNLDRISMIQFEGEGKTKSVLYLHDGDTVHTVRGDHTLARGLYRALKEGPIGLPNGPPEDPGPPEGRVPQ